MGERKGRNLGIVTYEYRINGPRVLGRNLGGKAQSSNTRVAFMEWDFADSYSFFHVIPI